MNNKKHNSLLIEFLLGIVVYALILLIANKLFKGFYIESFWYALVAALIVSILNVTVKPFLTFMTLPLTIYTLGFFYPVVNLLVLKLTDLIMGSHFILEGFLIPFFISIFISILRIVCDGLIVKPLSRRHR